MFKRISYTIALQFMVFVLLIMLINGVIFLAADFGNAHRLTNERLVSMSQSVLLHADHFPYGIPDKIPPQLRYRVRIVDGLSRVVYAGGLFDNIPFSDQEGFSTALVDGERYSIFTVSLLRDGQYAGQVQVADDERLQLREIPGRAFLYLLVSIGISVLMYLVGVSFARRSLRPAERMVEQLEQFTQDASHELRTPIAVVSSSLDLALKTGKHEDGIVSAKEDLKQVSALVERLLELARLDRFTLRRHAVDFSGLMTQSVERHRLLADERGISIEAVIEPDITVHGDDALLRQVIGNLLTNAIKFNKEKGAIRVLLTKRELMVEDTGIGIEPEALKRIFDRFYQADASRAGNNGFGLGLSLVKRIVDLHGWKIGVESEVGKGAKFTVAFR